MNKNRQLIVNMSASFVTYIVSFAISFFLSPYIVGSVGADAYGFIGLANNFISYATLVSVALNSMASRFITIKIHQKDEEGANRYFSSVFYANGIIALVLFLVFSVMFIFLEKMINIPAAIFWDVKALFAVLFINCLVSQMTSFLGVATFATNKLYLSSLCGIGAQMLRIAIIFTLFLLLSPRISYLGVATLACNLFGVIFNIYYTRKLLPNLRIKQKYFDFKVIKELLSSGVWNLITRLGQILQDGLDLLVTNLFINPLAMGVLSLSKMLPSIISGITGSVVTAFSPNFTQLYAEGKTDELLASVKQSIKIMGVVVNIPIIILLVCGDRFFAVWQPTQDARQLHILSVLACAGLIVVGGINCIYNIFTVVNKIKINSLLVCLTGLISTVTVFILLKTTDLGIYAVAGVSTIVATIRNLAFTIPYGAHCLGQKWYTLYPVVFRSVVFVAISVGVGYIIKPWIANNGWLGLFVLAGAVVLETGLIGAFIMLNKTDREYLLGKITRGRKKNASD